ncbi:MAG: SapC family protein [Desulfobacteraceae bacterium]|nr:SapC family protein [Desulfobacteraceae bacterium]
MFKKITVLNTNIHTGKKLLPMNSYNFVEKSHIVSLMVNEFTMAAPVYPIVFIKDGDMLKPFALLGLKQNENLFVGNNGQWQAEYIPATIRRYPFILGKTEARDDLALCIDEESEFLSDEEGNPLFDQDGKPTQIIENAKKYLSDLHSYSELTNRFCKELADWELLSPINIQVQKKVKGQDNPPLNIEGCFGVNEKNFNDLSDEVFLEIRKRGALPLIYAHLMSLLQTGRLARLQREKDNA